MTSYSAAKRATKPGDSGRGPTRLISPRRTCQSWGNSSSLVRTSHAPTRVRRVVARHGQQTAGGVRVHLAELQHPQPAAAVADTLRAIEHRRRASRSRSARRSARTAARGAGARGRRRRCRALRLAAGRARGRCAAAAARRGRGRDRSRPAASSARPPARARRSRPPPGCRSPSTATHPAARCRLPARARGAPRAVADRNGSMS